MHVPCDVIRIAGDEHFRPLLQEPFEPLPRVGDETRAGSCSLEHPGRW